MSRTNTDHEPESEFQRAAKDLLFRRLAAKTNGDRRALERELADLLCRHRERSAWDAMADAEAVEQAADVPRDTHRDQCCQAGPVAHDRKQLAAGDVE